MQYSKKELSNWYNFGELPKRKLPRYYTESLNYLDVFDVINDTLETYPDLIEALKEFINGK